ncbi:transporter substrate-binding domain-containing protein [Pseudomonas sp. PDM15]|jgi:polar amino acid transport system substrate-binding protein|uniref:substrate-binding periplasmic protein n=1 Tax=Pseudomonas sp. PDM15 TaxID=2769303 RepID=UPI00177DEADD|nr:transporter substrate-binding domain-containing protein [Pseudomonas sp. PDM15]MBD9425205.1 transporter substrate-binding domain-containing protein [Pseudomonas sp. PDM15]
MRWKTLLTICCLSWCLTTQAEPRELQISVGDWPPYLSQELRHSGVIAHIISDLFAEEGYKVSFRFLPWPRAYSAAAAGKFDATGVWMHKGEREADFLFSAPLLDERFVFFHLKSQPFDWHSFDDLAGMTLGGGLEYSYGPDFDAFLAKGKVHMERVSSDQQNFEKLLKERVVLYPQEINVGYAALSRHFTPAERARVTHHPRPLLINRSYLMLPRSLAGSEDLLLRFNQRLQAFRDSGRYDRYFQDLQAGKYMLTEEEATQASTE